MTPAREHQHHRRGDLSDTHREMLAILEDKVVELLSQHKQSTDAPTAANESSEHMRKIAGEVIGGRVTAHTLECLRPGGALREVTDKMESRVMIIDAKVQDHEQLLQRISGALGLTKVIVPLSAFVVIVTTLVRFYLEMRGHK